MNLVASLILLNSVSSNLMNYLENLLQMVFSLGLMFGISVLGAKFLNKFPFFNIMGYLTALLIFCGTTILIGITIYAVLTVSPELEKDVLDSLRGAFAMSALSVGLLINIGD